MSISHEVQPTVKAYLNEKKIPEILESLFTALTVNQPQDGRRFIIEKLQLLQKDPSLLHSLQWDTFIDPAKKPIIRKTLFTNLSKELDQPSLEMLEKAYTFYNNKILKSSFRALLSFWIYRKEKRIEFENKLVVARNYFITKFYSTYFDKWKFWMWKIKEKQYKFMKTLENVYFLALKRVVFKAWFTVMLDAKKTREYFEKIERGEVFDHSNIHGEKKDHISLLPKHLAAHIFIFLDLPDLVSCSRVCHTWKEVSQASILWNRVDLTKAEEGFISNRGLTILLQKIRPFLVHLNIRGCNYITPKTMKNIGFCHNLQDLNMSYCNEIDDDIMKDIFCGCPTLLYVNISHTNISDATLRHLSRSCGSLQYLNISHCMNISDKGLQYLSNGKSASKLSYLNVSACEQITKHGYNHLSKGCPKIAVLLMNELPSLNDRCVEIGAGMLKNLRNISILHSTLLTDSSIKCLAALKKLQVVKIEGNNRITDASVKSLVKLCPDLQYLYLVDMQRITDISLKALAQCTNMEVLNLADCVRISDAGVRYLAEGHSASKLRELNLTNCIRVSDVSLLRLSQKCHALTYVNFSYCEQITDAGVELISGIDAIISIDLSGCNITDVGVIALGVNPFLKDIAISECYKVTSTGLQKLVNHVKDLETLDISFVSKVTDGAIKSLAFYCRKLRVLNVAGCLQISDQGLQYLSGVCRYIERLDISGCSLVSDRALRYLRKGCVQLKRLNILYCKGISKSGAAKMKSNARINVMYSQDDPPLGFINGAS